MKSREAPSLRIIDIGCNSGGFIPLAHFPSGKVFDHKGDPDIQASIQFWTNGQPPYGEWIKKLGRNDRAPRGQCAKLLKRKRAEGFV